MTFRILFAAMVLACFAAAPVWAAAKADGVIQSRPAQDMPWDGAFPASITPMKAPPGFTVQELDPIGARVFKPAGWFYDRAYDHRGYTWVLSQENPASGSGYKTGLRIQMLQGIHRGTKKEPGQFVAEFLDHKKADGAKVVAATMPSGCGQIFPSYLRSCLETEEKIEGFGDEIFHITYSALWNNDTDTAMLMIFGTPAKDWAKYRDVADRMINGADLPDLQQRLRDVMGHRTNCPAGMAHVPEEKLYKYVQASGEGKPGLFTVAGLGNAQFAIGSNDPHPMSAGQFAAVVKAAKNYKPDAKVLLLWPYSTAGNAPFAKALHDALGNEILGANGPLWWYPDGTAVATDPAQGLQLPVAKNAQTCFMADGAMTSGETCRKTIAARDGSQAIFGNTIFMPPNCDALGVLAFNAVLGQRDDSLALYFYYSFVAPNADKASTYLSLAAFGHQSLAEYYAAEEVRSSNHGLYLKMLERAAADGDTKAGDELKAAQGKKP